MRAGSAATRTMTTQHSILSEAQREAFRARGVVKVPGLLAADVVRSALDLVMGGLERAGVCDQGRWTAPRLNGLADMARQSKLTKPLKQSVRNHAVFNALCGTEVEAAARALLDDREVSCPVPRPQLLFTPPNAESWALPRKLWHVDAPRLGAAGCPGVQAFLFLQFVAPGGGGTVVAAGSHRYLNDCGKVRSKDIKKRLRTEHPFFRELMNRAQPEGNAVDEARLMALTQDGDIPLQVVELTGEPGDVWFTDLRLLHSLAPNSSDQPRLMVTQRYFLPELVDRLYDGSDGEAQA